MATILPATTLAVQLDTQPGLACAFPMDEPEPASIHGPSIPITDQQVLRSALAAGERVAYHFDALERQTYLVELAQERLDLVVSVEFPDGSRRSYNSPLRRNEAEFILLESTSVGRHQVTVWSDEYTGAVGAHEIRLNLVPDTIEGPLLQTWRLLSEGAGLNYAGDRENSERARRAYREAAELAEEQGSGRLHAYAVYASAMIDYWHFNAMPDAAAAAKQVAELYTTLNEPVLAASAVFLHAAALIDMTTSPDELALALELFDRAAAVQTQFGQLFALAHTINNIGLTHFYLVDLQNARGHWQQAATMFRGQREYSGELLTMGNLGTLNLDEGYLVSAVEALERVRDLQPAGKNLRHTVDVLSNLALANRILNNFDEALRGFSCARLIAEQIDYPWGFGWALAGIGETYYAMGELALAGEYLRAALPAERLAGDRRGEAVVLRYLGNIESLNGNFEAALDYHRRALEITTAAPDRALVQLHIAGDLSALDRHEPALALLADALTTARQSGSRLLVADAEQAMGRALFAAGRYSEALNVLDSAAESYRALDTTAERARTLHAMALSARASGNLDGAIDYGEASLDLIEQVRGSVSDPELRAFYLSARRGYFELQVDLLMQRQRERPDEPHAHLASALAVSERSRARLTLDLLQRRVIDPGIGDADVSRRRSELYAALAEQRYRRDKLVRSSKGAPIGEALTSLLPILAEIENELNLLETAARDTGADGRGVTTETLGLREMQEALDADSALIQYALGAETSYVWVVTRESVSAAELPGRAIIDALARQVFEDLSVFEPGPRGRSAADSRRRRLADMVIAPILEYLTKRRLVVAADGALQYIPFGALPVARADGSQQSMIERYEIVGVPSLSAVAASRERTPAGTPSRTIAVFADPVFEAADVRLADLPIRTLPAVGDASNILTLTNLRSEVPLTRLPWTMREASTIRDLLGVDERRIALGFDASVAAVASADLRDYRILHFATHGVIDTAYPDLSALVFSQFDAEGVPQDGYLELHDIYGLDLQAELVVLSACETALGREIRAEGLLGLSQGFMHAGARSLIATLWPVSDRATAELMAAFYDALLIAGARPAEALRQAQVRIALQPRWRDPYFWAGFVLIGDWR